RTLRTVAVPEEQAEASHRSPFTRPIQGRAQGSGADNPVRAVPVDRLAGEVVPGCVLGIPANAGHELVYEDEVVVHRRCPRMAREMTLSMTSLSGKPAAAIILG